MPLMISVFYMFLDASIQRLLAARDSRADPPAYRERIGRMADDGARSRSRAGLWLLQQLLLAAGYPGNPLDGIGFSASGRPQIAGVPPFSISHSETLVACALSDGARVGLDVERRRPRDMKRMARLLDTGERCHVERMPMAFFDYWCAREATVKASGRVGLKRIRALTLDGGTAHLDDREWFLHPLDLSVDHAACLASDRAIGRVDIRELNIRAAENTGR